jgi:apolipoprotein N-acyltransferase
MNPTAALSTPWYRSTLAIALTGSLLLWAALPPLSWGFLGWVAPVPWLVLIQVTELHGRRPYRALWTAGFVFWLLAIHWLRLPHPATHLGWLALAAYLAFYLPLFVGLSRVAVHQIGAPLWLVAPIVWTGLELARAHLLTGFLMGSLAHTQVAWTQVIQISDLVGEYGVDFLIMLLAACVVEGFRIADFGLRIARKIPQSEIRNPQSRFRPLAFIPGAIALTLTLAYGHWQLGQVDSASANRDSNARTIRIALIQGNSLAEWKFDPSRERQIMDEYISLSEEAVKSAKSRGDGRPVDLVVWPETMFRTPLVTFDPGYQPPPDATRTPEEIASYGPRDLASLAQRLETPVLVGIERVHFPAAAAPGDENPPALRYNSAVLVDRDGTIIGTYDKVHRVMFGEFIPFAKWLPFLYRLTPLTGGIEAGEGPVVFELNDRFYAPNICYETVIPHVIRRQANTLVGGSVPADVLINMTNDAWYWGSSELDMHLACGVFRAIETRKPLVIAANGGLSAWIDRYGRVREVSPRQKPHIILADVEPGYVTSWYQEFGDWFAGLCLACCITLAIIGWRASRLQKSMPSPSDSEPSTLNSRA